MVKLQVTFALLAICLTLVLSAPSDDLDNHSRDPRSAFGNRRPYSTTPSPTSKTPSPSSSTPSSPKPPSSTTPSSPPSTTTIPPSTTTIPPPPSTTPNHSDDYSYYDYACPDYEMEYEEDMPSSSAPSPSAEL